MLRTLSLLCYFRFVASSAFKPVPKIGEVIIIMYKLWQLFKSNLHIHILLGFTGLYIC